MGEIWHFLAIMFDHLPYFITTAIFRVGTYVILLVYMFFGLLAIPVFFIATLVRGYTRYKSYVIDA